MRGILRIVTPATDLALLTPDERRAAAGLRSVDTSQDPLLEAMDRRVAASICAECNVAVAAGAVPTLLQETLEETFRGVRGEDLLLARRHEVEIVSLNIGGSMLTGTDHYVDPEVGILRRLYDDQIVTWGAGKIVVTYKAGFQEIPADLKMAALDFFRFAWLERERDPSLKSEEIDVPDVMRTKRDYWVGAIPGCSGEAAVPPVVAGQLIRYRNLLGP
ncbi:hypothetical protein [Rhizobium sp. Leaf383]|uniref:hypothetical protein n=1 Tax=Rhizobium sp. Leaf383 TaxID=1736357 RepID=UPI000714ECC3|nr:hypothetical protein [Rhizobium sp. Leaf383]KQS78087.1 hypothetical protein ASG58_06665 [Rhizobium sp. Leaf383]